MLCSPAELLATARARRYAIAAFNIASAEQVRGLVEAANTLRSPVILQTSVKTARYYGPEFLFRIVFETARASTVPVALHLDHCRDPDFIDLCIRCGWTSVMIDASELPLEQNMATTRSVVEAAHARGVAVEGELGAVGGAEDGVTSARNGYVKPEEVEAFVGTTRLDMLAVGIGTFHGRRADAPAIRFDLLDRVARLVPLPLVLHGGTGIPDGDVRRAIALGIAKINISTELKECTHTALNESLGEVERYDPIRCLEAVEQAARRMAERKITAFGSAHTIAKCE